MFAKTRNEILALHQPKEPSIKQPTLKELINRYADIIIEFKQREKKLFAQIARRNQGLRLCQKELEFKDKEIIHLLNLLKDKNNKIKVLERKNIILNESQNLLKNEIENKNEQIISLQNELQIKNENIYTPQLERVFLSDIDYQINDINVDELLEVPATRLLTVDNKSTIPESEENLILDIEEQEVLETIVDMQINDEISIIDKKQLIELELAPIEIAISVQRKETVASHCVSVGIDVNDAARKIDKIEIKKDGIGVSSAPYHDKAVNRPANVIRLEVAAQVLNRPAIGILLSVEVAAKECSKKTLNEEIKSDNDKIRSDKFDVIVKGVNCASNKIAESVNGSLLIDKNNGECGSSITIDGILLSEDLSGQKDHNKLQRKEVVALSHVTVGISINSAPYDLNKLKNSALHKIDTIDNNYNNINDGILLDDVLLWNGIIDNDHDTELKIDDKSKLKHIKGLAPVVSV